MVSERLERAIRLVLQAHAGQVRKLEPDVPYATHPLHVAFLVREAGGSEDATIAALLHDVLEDSDLTSEELEESFGSSVSGIVREVSEDKSLEWSERKAGLVARLATASAEACLVAAADKTHNLATLHAAHERYGESVWKAFRAPPRETIRFYEDALAVLRKRVPAGLSRDFATALQAARVLIGDSRLE